MKSRTISSDRAADIFHGFAPKRVQRLFVAGDALHLRNVMDTEKARHVTRDGRYAHIPGAFTSAALIVTEEARTKM